ncbi:MAG: signal peptidase II [Candidatus Gastranaerophilales bacterium]|nr:signal peptidase II [Candidatus Gastranaerophilales bacterium]
MKDKRACIFYFLMTIILLDFGNQIRKLSYSPYLTNADNPFFSINHINNSGSAFSLFQNQSAILAIFGILAVLFIAYQVIKKITFNDKLQLLSMTIFSAGALGNVIERIQFKYVIDYIKLNFINFPIFNAFDIMICVGIFLYCIYLFLDFKKAKNEQN